MPAIGIKQNTIFNLITIGNNKIISISKIKNKSANKKNCIENGDRELLIGSNPHSKEVSFAHSNRQFWLTITPKITKAIIKKNTH